MIYDIIFLVALKAAYLAFAAFVLTPTIQSGRAIDD